MALDCQWLTECPPPFPSCTGRFCAQRQRTADHVSIQGEYNGPLERRPRQCVPSIPRRPPSRVQANHAASCTSDDYAAFHKANSRLLNTSRELKNVPIRVYIPQSPDGNDAPNGTGSFKVVQSLIQPRVSESMLPPFGRPLSSPYPRPGPTTAPPRHAF
jgi:hypothetical protein